MFDSDLILQTFSDTEPQENKPRLRWPGRPGDAEFKAMMVGIRAYGQGAFMTITNRSTHDLKELTKSEALERLAALSLFCRYVEQCSLSIYRASLDAEPATGDR